jgi:hypothetical protein
MRCYPPLRSWQSRQVVRKARELVAVKGFELLQMIARGHRTPAFDKVAQLPREVSVILRCQARDHGTIVAQSILAMA